MSTLTIDDAIITLVTEGTADADYTRRRDVRSWLVTAGPTAAWVAIRDRSGDFEVSDPFPVTATAEVSAWHREQAYAAAHDGITVTVADAADRCQARAVVTPITRKRASKASS